MNDENPKPEGAVTETPPIELLEKVMADMLDGKDVGASYWGRTLRGFRQALDAARKEKAADKGAQENSAASETTEYERAVADLRRAYLAGATGGRRQRLAREFDRAAGNPEEFYCPALSGFPALSRRKPGPKPRSGLC